MQIQLIWTDPQTGAQIRPLLETPIAFGREFAAMPDVIDGERISRVVLADDRVEPFHALITEQNAQLLVTDQGSRSGTQINGVALPSSTLLDGDRLQIGSIQVLVNLSGTNIFRSGAVAARAAPAGCDRQIGFLFKRRCGRTNSEGCPYCDAGANGLVNDPYFYDRSYYPDYGSYGHGYWGSNYYDNRERYGYDPNAGVDFTEADANSFENEADGDYEQDMGAS